MPELLSASVPNGLPPEQTTQMIEEIYTLQSLSPNDEGMQTIVLMPVEQKVPFVTGTKYPKLINIFQASITRTIGRAKGIIAQHQQKFWPKVSPFLETPEASVEVSNPIVDINTYYVETNIVQEPQRGIFTQLLVEFQWDIENNARGSTRKEQFSALNHRWLRGLIDMNKKRLAYESDSDEYPQVMEEFEGVKRTMREEVGAKLSAMPVAEQDTRTPEQILVEMERGVMREQAAYWALSQALNEHKLQIYVSSVKRDLFRETDLWVVDPGDRDRVVFDIQVAGRSNIEDRNPQIFDILDVRGLDTFKRNAERLQGIQPSTLKNMVSKTERLFEFHQDGRIAHPLFILVSENDFYEATGMPRELFINKIRTFFNAPALSALVKVKR